LREVSDADRADAVGDANPFMILGVMKVVRVSSHCGFSRKLFTQAVRQRFWGISVFHFPFSILGLSFAIACLVRFKQWQMTNLKWKMENERRFSKFFRQLLLRL